MCVGRNSWEKGKKEGEKNKKGKGISAEGIQENNTYLKAPQGPSMLFPQYHWMKVQSLENLMKTETDSQLVLCMCVCVFMCVRRGKAAALSPSVTPVKSMPNEDADDVANTLSHTKTTYRGAFLTPLIIPP